MEVRTTLLGLEAQCSPRRMHQTLKTTFYFVADNDTATAIVPILRQNCLSVLDSGVSNTPVPYNLSDPNAPKPEQAVQYYQASSAALMLTGYSNAAQLPDNTSLPDPTNIDTGLPACLKQTIVAIPFVDAANPVAWNFGVTLSVCTLSGLWFLHYVLSGILYTLIDGSGLLGSHSLQSTCKWQKEVHTHILGTS
ncbi:hypothetical protein BJ322DRAFT_301157 [Thelephora terrestris]|uniref:Uncharacterized protein n=1 Tax=Thelephora terrestris TaxID=56493 RepID=A0A9P6L2L9_9AGAM|nr:hypothetical protein BJ322DRAFT_301157 [Thelephora terrestris]